MIPNYEKLIKKYGGKWVALNVDSSKVVVSGNSAKKVYTEAKKEGYKIPKLYRVPQKYIPYIG